MSGYLQETATHDEVLVARASFSWLYLAFAMLPFWGGLIILYVLFQYLAHSFFSQLPFTAALMRYGFIGIIVIGAFRYLSIALPWVNTEIAVTNRRVVYRRGVIARQVDEVAINRIEGVNLNQTMMGRMCNFGSVNIMGIGVDQINLPPISQPLVFRRAIQEAIESAQNPDAPFT